MADQHDELADVIGPGRWVWRAFIVATFLVILISAIISATHTPATPASVAEIRGIVSSQASRNDCRTELNTVLQKVKDDRFNLLIDLSVTTPETPPTQAELAAIQAANSAVDHLPTLQQAIDHGVTIAGKHYAPCPKVKP